jgi:flotillin
MTIFIIAIAVAASIAAATVLAFFFRTVVPTNMVHIVQSSGKTTSYGSNLEAGNVYYEIPSFVPRFGVSVIELPVSNFSLELEGYQAYDREKVPFVVDVVAFFRFVDTTFAAKSIESFGVMRDQLYQVIQGAVRRILADAEIDEIMLQRARFGAAFTAEVTDQLKEWGIEPVKSLELMDIRDAEGSDVIASIMAKRVSFIEMQSRQEVAKNHQAAEQTEIEARREVELQKQQAEEQVGKRSAERELAVGTANQQAQQAVLQESKLTKEREMEVAAVAATRAAEIARSRDLITADAAKQTTVLKAEADLEAARRAADGVLAAGTARAESEKAMQLASVTAQAELAKQIGENASYQEYLVKIEQVKAAIEVGTAQAQALSKANVKVLVNTADGANAIGAAGQALGANLNALIDSVPALQRIAGESA